MLSHLTRSKFGRLQPPALTGAGAAAVLAAHVVYFSMFHPMKQRSGWLCTSAPYFPFN